MKFSVNDNEADIRSRRTPSARSIRSNERREKQSKSVLFHTNSPKRTAMPTAPFRKQFSIHGDGEQDSPTIADVTQIGDVNANRVGLVSESSNASISIKTVPKPNGTDSKKPNVLVRRSSCSRDSRNRSESVSSDSTESSKRSAVQSAYSLQSSSAWDAFDDYVKNIDDSTDYSNQQKVSFRSSDTFQKTMLGLYGKSDYSKRVGLSKFRAKLGTIASLTNRFARACNDKASENGDSETDYEMPDKNTIANAQRGWRILRRYVNERIAKKKGSSASLNWSMLQQTMRGMSDMEKARIDLYKRYGIIPTVNSDGIVVQENTMLSEGARAHAQLVASAKGRDSAAAVPRRRTQSHKPPSWSQRNSLTSYHRMPFKHRRPKSSVNP